MYADLAGQGSVTAAKMAVEDFGGKVLGKPIEVIFADHQNKPDVGSSIASQWIDTDKVDVIIDVPTSSVALAIRKSPRTRTACYINSGAASSDLTGKACSPTRHPLDLRHLCARQRHRHDHREGRRRQLVFHHGRLRLRPRAGKGHHGRRHGSGRQGSGRAYARRSPAPPTSPPSCCRRRAPSAKVIGLANAGGDTINSIKQAGEFGLVAAGQKLAGLLVFLSDMHSLGLKTAQGLTSPMAGIGTSTTRPGPGRRRSAPATATRCPPWFRPASTRRRALSEGGRRRQDR